MSVPPPWEPEGREQRRWLPSTPFRFTATRSVTVLGPDSHEAVGVLEKDSTCRATLLSGRWVLAEDRSGHRGWVPLGVVPVWHPGGPALVAVLVSVLVTGGTAALGFLAAAEYSGCFFDCDGPNRLGGVLLALTAAVVLVGGMVVTRRVGTGGRGTPSLREASALAMAPAACGVLLWLAPARLWAIGWSIAGLVVVGSWFVWWAAARSRAGRRPSLAQPAQAVGPPERRGGA